MKILVIGSQGFIGTAAMSYFSKAGHQVYGCGVSGTTDDHYFVVQRGNPDYEAVLKNNRFDVCINAAGSPGIGFSLANPLEDFQMNVINVNNLLHAIRVHQPECFFVLLSSAAIYGNPGTLPVEEFSPANPLSPYGFNKLQAELLVQQYASCYGIKATVFRIFSAYGNGLKKQLFWDIYQKAISSAATIQLFGTGTETRDFIFISDVLKAINTLICYNNNRFNIFNLGSGTETTISEAAQVFLAQLQIQKPIVFNQQIKAGDPVHWQAAMEKLGQHGFRTAVSLTNGLKKYAQWLTMQQ